MHRRAARERHRAGPQGVVRGGYEDLVAVVDERLQRHRDENKGAVADEHVLDVRVRQTFGLVVLRDGGARRVDAARVRVALRLRKMMDDVRCDGRGCLEAERRRVADVQARILWPSDSRRCASTDRASDVVPDVLENSCSV